MSSLLFRKATCVQALGWIGRLSPSCPPPASPSRPLSSGAKRMVQGCLYLAPRPSTTTTQTWGASIGETKSGGTKAAEPNAENFTNTYLTSPSRTPSFYRRATVGDELVIVAELCVPFLSDTSPPPSLKAIPPRRRNTREHAARGVTAVPSVGCGCAIRESRAQTASCRGTLGSTICN